MDLSERVASFIRREALLKTGQKLVVGVSGGPDSLCLLSCLVDQGFRPLVAHFDHQLRAESAEDAKFVHDVAKSYGVPFRLGKGSAFNQAQSSEEASRILRYRFLSNVANEEGLDRIAVGHTANDQAETVLMHLIRGAGPSGLRGMLPRTDLSSWAGIAEAENLCLIRPLLEVWRWETENYCVERELAARNDPSNQDPRFFRNRLRNELLPELESYNPRVKEVLLRTAKVMAAETEAIEGFVDAYWPDWVTPVGEGALKLHLDSISKAPLALQRAAMRRAILQLAPELRDIGFDSVERALTALRKGRRSSVSGGLDLLSINGDAILRKPEAAIALTNVPQLGVVEPVSLVIPFRLELESGWSIEANLIEPGRDVPKGADEVWFDGGEFGHEIEVRNAQSGDRFSPFGMSGSMKVSDLYINRKVPQLARAQWPMVVSNGQIAWVPGLHRSDLAQVTPLSRSIVRMRLLPPEEATI